MVLLLIVSVGWSVQLSLYDLAAMYAARVLGQAAVLAALPPLILVMLCTGVLGAAANIAQSGFMFTGEKMNTDLNK
ncbi:hypothetical protein AB4142_35540, partial [Variovorax sp. 2RAF20]